MISSLYETTIRIRSLDLIFKLTTNIKNAYRRYLFDNLRLNLTTFKQTVKNKQMIELMHKHMTMNYINAVQELYKNKIKSLTGAKDTYVEDDLLLSDDEDKPEYKLPLKRHNVYSYGWYHQIEPRPIPFDVDENVEEKTIIESKHDITIDEDTSFYVTPYRNLKTNYLKNTLKRGNNTTSINSTRYADK